MKTKIATDVTQSKELAKILPVESADMYWWHSGTRYYIESMDDDDYNDNVDIPAWSLSALLNTMSYPSLHKTIDGWRCDTYNSEKNKYILGNNADNPVDACVELIFKLNELRV